MAVTPCPPNMEKVVAAALLYGIRVYKRNDGEPLDETFQGGVTLRRSGYGWNVPLTAYRNFGRPSQRFPEPLEGHMTLGSGGPTLDQWITLFRDLEAGGGWEWDVSFDERNTTEWTLP